MRIALVSYECPPDTAAGGIGTYVRHAARMLKNSGNDPEIFAGTPGVTRSGFENGTLVHRVHETQFAEFHKSIAPAFAERHAEIPFDVVEGPEFGADSLTIMKQHPDVPSVVRLHTPSIVLLETNNRLATLKQRLVGAAIAVKQRRRPHWGYPPSLSAYVNNIKMRDRLEQAAASEATLLTSPSLAMAEMVASRWNLGLAEVIPNPFEHAEFGGDCHDAEVSGYVTYVGLLDRRKGVFELAAAAAHARRERPELRFRFVGPEYGVDIADSEIRKLITKTIGERFVDFTGQVPADRVRGFLCEAEIVVVPSLWENFPYSALEAMALGKPLVAARVGGIPELVGGEGAGVLIDAHDIDVFAQELVRLSSDSKLRRSVGLAAKARVQDHFAGERLVDRQLELYEKAIHLHRRPDRQRPGSREGKF